MERLLDIGFPFVGHRGGDASRALMEDRVLKTRFQVDHLLLLQAHQDKANITSKHGGDSAAVLRCRPGCGLRPAAVCQFEKEELGHFRALLRDRQYRAVFFRYICGTGLVNEVKRVRPNMRIIIDADMLSSRIAAQAWEQNRSMGNRFFFFESLKTRQYERTLFNRPYLFCMSNADELAWVRRHYLRPGARSQFALVPNIMPDVPAEVIQEVTPASARYILFHGILSSTVNMDAFHFLVKEIYPQIHEALEKHNISVYVVGKGLSAVHRELIQHYGCTHIALIGEVEDISRVITECLFCLVPLRIGSGTKTRILEAAACGKAVVTTPIGVEGLDFGEEEIVVCTEASSLAHAIIGLLENRSTLKDLGAGIREKSLRLYSQEAVGRGLVQTLEEYLAS